METNRGFNSRHKTLYFTLFMSVTSIDYYLSTKDKYQTFYVSLSRLFKSLTFNATLEKEVEVIEKHYMLDLHWKYIDSKLK